MDIEEVHIGQIVCSKSGRDGGKFFIVYDIINKSFVQIVDGVLRKLEKPKKKNIKHLEFYQVIDEDIADKIKKGEKVTNDQVKAAIEKLVAQIKATNL